MKQQTSGRGLAELRAHADRQIAQVGGGAPSCGGGTVAEAIERSLSQYNPADPKSYMDTYISIVVDAAPPFTAEQAGKVAALLGYGARAIDGPLRRAKAAAPVMRGALARKSVNDHWRQERAREIAADTAAARRALSRRRDPADIAIEVLTERIAAIQKAAPDPIVDEARRIAAQTGQSFQGALANARAMREARALDERRRATHADGHMWCIASECPSAWREEPES